MRTFYRKKHPYYGKYKCKAEFDWNAIIHAFGDSSLALYLSNLINFDNYMLYGYYSIYLEEEKHLDIIINDARLGDLIMFVYRPAPGYQTLTGTEPKKEKTLWYDRYSYKITVHVERPNKHEMAETDNITLWCDENLKHAYRKSGTWGNVSFFFSNKHDAIAFKLTYGDKVEKQEILNKKIAVKKLKERIQKAEKDLEIYLKGEEQ